MARIEVHTVGQAKADGQKMQSLGQNLTDFEGRLTTLCNNLADAWPSDTADATTYLQGIRNNASKLNQIADATISSGRIFELNAVAQEEEIAKR